MECEEQTPSGIDEHLRIYNERVKEKARKLDEIEELKQQITSLRKDIVNIDVQVKEEEMKILLEVYQVYSEKDLLCMAKYVEKNSTREHADNFKELITKFNDHKLEVNDISNLQTYFKIYGDAIKKKTVLKRFFKALGGDLDD